MNRLFIESKEPQPLHPLQRIESLRQLGDAASKLSEQKDAEQFWNEAETYQESPRCRRCGPCTNWTSNMQVIPAIDLRDGKCVRLRQGDFARETVYGDDPVAVARQWVNAGAERLHLVDLDGARAGRPVNTAIIGRIVEAAGVPCQLGGGMRDRSAVEQALGLGIERVIVGTRAARDPEWFGQLAGDFPHRLVLGLDGQGGRLAVAGWQEWEDQGLGIEALARQYDPLPLAAIVCTDISRDGMLSGPNFDLLESLARSCRHPVIASGGIASADDVLGLRRRGLAACILGRSLYEGTIDLPALLRLLRPKEPRFD